MNKTIFYFMLASIIVLACTKNETNNADCGETTVTDLTKFNRRTIQDSILSIIEEPIIENNCLTLVLGYSGCNDKHNIDLIGDGAILESLPVQTNFRLLDNNDQLCDAYFTDTYNFDLNSLKAKFKNEKSVRFNFSDQNRSILWQIK